MTSTSGPAISVRGLRKSYGEIEAVRGVDLEVQRGEVFALLGPNGAGKTTTVEILEGHRSFDAGDVRVLGFDPAEQQRAFKERIGIVLQETGVEPYLTVEEVLELFRGYYPNPRSVDELLKLVGLEEQRKQRVIRLSGGQQRRLDVAAGLAGDPDLLFLDEPTTGFDPAARREAWSVISGLQALGKTILLTTHYMEEAERLADRVAIIRKGQIVAQGTPGALIENDGETLIKFRAPDNPAALLTGLESMTKNDDGFVTIETSTPTAVLYQLTGRAHDSGLELSELSVSHPSLEDVYLRFVSDEAEA